MEMKEKTMKSQEKTSRLEDALTNVRTSQQREQFLKQYTEDGYDRFADYLDEYIGGARYRSGGTPLQEQHRVETMCTTSSTVTGIQAGRRS